MLNYEHFARLPGMGDIQQNVEAALTWGMWEWNKAFILPCILNGAARDAGNSPTTLLRPGLLMGQNRTTLKWQEWTPAATDGTEIIGGILLYDQNMQELGVDQDRWFGYVLGGGFVKASGIIVPGQAAAGLSGQALEFYVRGSMAGRFQFDDYIQQWKESPLMGWKTIRTLTDDHTALTSEDGTLFIQTTKECTVTLPAVAKSKGLRYGLYITTDHGGGFASAAAGGLIAYNDAAANSVSIKSTGKAIGGHIEVLGIDNSKWATMMHLADAAQTVTIVT